MTVVPLRPPANHRSDPIPFRLGVNYWPATKGVTLWKNFDIDEVHCDMNAIAELGLDVVRVFLTWEDFQPDPEGVKCCSLARLTALCDAVAAEGLKAIITLNMGHFGGHNWAPSWLLDSNAPELSYPTISNGQRVQQGYRDPYNDPTARKAALRLVRAISKTLADHQAVLAYDLGNEVRQFAPRVTTEGLRSWYGEMIETVRSLDPKHDITCGVALPGSLPDLANAESAFGFASVHLDVGGLALARGFLDSDLLPFGCALASSLTERPSFASDWNVATESWTEGSSLGAPAWLAGEAAAAGFAEELLPKLLEAGAIGALVGNFSDIDPTLYAQAPYDTRQLERHRGLVRADGTVKPHGQVVRKFAESNPQVQPKSAVIASKYDFAMDPVEQARRLYGIFATRSAGHVRGQLG